MKPHEWGTQICGRAPGESQYEPKCGVIFKPGYSGRYRTLRTIMPILDELERRALFRLTRSLAFIVVFVLTLGLIISTVIFAGDLIPSGSTNVSYKKIWTRLHTATPAPEISGAGVLPDVDTGPTAVDIPVQLQPYFTSADNKRALYEHLSALDVDGRKDYLANLFEVMNEAKTRNELDDTVINTYYQMKDSQIASANEGRALGTTTRLYILGGAVSTLFMIALCSLILVLLAIERNTRQPRRSMAIH
jgi:hypothetical protein